MLCSRSSCKAHTWVLPQSRAVLLSTYGIIATGTNDAWCATGSKQLGSTGTSTITDCEFGSSCLYLLLRRMISWSWSSGIIQRFSSLSADFYLGTAFLNFPLSFSWIHFNFLQIIVAIMFPFSTKYSFVSADGEVWCYVKVHVLLNFILRPWT